VKVLVPILIALATLPPLRADLLLQPNDRVLVACEVPLDQGMISVDLAAYFLMCQPVDGLEVIGSNEAQEEVEPFLHRIPTEIAAWSPTVALISHGGNDGHDLDGRGLSVYHPAALNQTLDALKKIGVRAIVLGSASAMDTTFFKDMPAGPYNDRLARFRDLDRDIAAKAGVPFVDVFGATLDVMGKAKAGLGDSYPFDDAEHGRFTSRSAQLVIAWAFLKALGADGNIGTITVDLAANTATGTPGQKIVSVQNGSVNVESTRYPFCFTGGPAYPGANATADIVNYFPFNQDLNRYLLVVKGLTAAKAKVTWGDTTKEFSAAELAHGVNLAAAFAGHTPFESVFNHTVDALWQQQLKQYIWNDNTIAHLDDIKKMAPGAPVDQLIAGIHAQDAQNLAAAKALAVPVDHTIKIEPEP
jgi:hypothetical protein